ncbi:MAG: ATP-dependent helicase [Desulfobacteraceae bacterium]|nr:MAG: ATP-dependent helicase [Desulfobacteraceae bacterium]
MIRGFTLRFPGYEPAHRLTLRILVEENYHPRDIVRCLERINKIGCLRPEYNAVYGVKEFELSHYKKALPLLEKARELPPHLLEEWGYRPWTIQSCLQACRSKVGLNSLNSSGPDASGVRKSAKAGAVSKEKAGQPAKARAEKKGNPGRIKRQKAKHADRIPEQKPSDTEIKGIDAVLVKEKPKIVLSAAVGSPAELHERFAAGNVSGISKYFLAQQASRISQADHFDSLICLNTLKDIEQYNYQVETVRKVMRSFRGRVLLADEVGLGKTIEAGMVLKEYMLRGMVKKALILTPPALVSQWCEELSSKFGIAPVSTENGELRQDPEGFWKVNDLIVASLALARNKRNRPLLGSIRFDLVIVDEAHHVKNDGTAGWMLVNELKSRFLLLLSATPVENNLMDLFSLVTLLKPGQLGTKTSFRRSFVLRGDPTQPRNRERLRELVGEVMIRNTRAIADIKLPARHASTVLVEGEPAERELYAKLTDLVREGFQSNVSRLALGLLLQEAGSSPRAVRKTLLKMAGHSDLDDNMKSRMTRLAKLCEYVPNTSKTARLLDLLKISKSKVLVFSRFSATLEEIAQRLSESGIGFSMFHGQMSAADKDRAVCAFQDGTDVMLCSEIGGEGRNLQFCSTMVNFDLPWNPMKIEQRIGRIHRIGQTRPVHVYNLCSADTAEHHILEVLDRRINMFELVIGEMDLVLGQTKSEKEFEDRILDIYGESKNEQDITEAFDRLGDELLAAREQYAKIKRLDSEIFANDYEI